MKQALRMLIISCILGVLLAFQFQMGEVNASSNTCGSWTLVTSPNVGQDDTLLGTAAIGTNNVWVVGYRFKGNNLLTLIEHWNGTKWTLVTGPNPGTSSNSLNALARIPGTKQLWAVGDYSNANDGTSQTLIEQWNGTSWTVISSPNPGSTNTLGGVVALSATNAWAVGSYNTPTTSTQTLIEHWNGSNWSIVPSPNLSMNGSLTGVAAVSANNIWAVGSYFNNRSSMNQNLIEHWNGTKWSIASSPDTGTNDQLEAVTAVPSTKEVWAVGLYYNSSGISQTLTEQFSGTAWSIVLSSSPGTMFNDLQAIAAVSASSIWAVGSYSSSKGDVSQTLAEQWNGTSWNVVSTPDGSTSGNFLDAVTSVPATSQFWAAGAYDTPTTNNLSLTEFYC